MKNLLIFATLLIILSCDTAPQGTTRPSYHKPGNEGTVPLAAYYLTSMKIYPGLYTDEDGDGTYTTTVTRHMWGINAFTYTVHGNQKGEWSKIEIIMENNIYEIGYRSRYNLMRALTFIFKKLVDKEHFQYRSYRKISESIIGERFIYINPNSMNEYEALILGHVELERFQSQYVKFIEHVMKTQVIIQPGKIRVDIQRTPLVEDYQWKDPYLIHITITPDSN